MPLAALLVIASAFWGTPACGQPSITTEVLPPPIVGLATPSECLITLDRRQWAAGEACQIALHEYGHLMGRQHSLDPNDVMYPVLRPPRWPCAW